MSDPLDNEFVRHVRKYRPDSVTARLSVEVEERRKNQGVMATEIALLKQRLGGGDYGKLRDDVVEEYDV